MASYEDYKNAVIASNGSNSDSSGERSAYLPTGQASADVYNNWVAEQRANVGKPYKQSDNPWIKGLNGNKNAYNNYLYKSSSSSAAMPRSNGRTPPDGTSTWSATPYGPDNPWRDSPEEESLLDKFKKYYPGQPWEGLTDEQLQEYVTRFEQKNQGYGHNTSTPQERFRDNYGYLPPDYMSEANIYKAIGDYRGYNMAIYGNPYGDPANNADAQRYMQLQERGEASRSSPKNVPAPQSVEQNNPPDVKSTDKPADVLRDGFNALFNYSGTPTMETDSGTGNPRTTVIGPPKGPHFEYHPEDQIGSPAWNANVKGRSMTDYYRNQLLQEQLKAAGYQGDPHALAYSEDVLNSDEGPWGYLANIAENGVGNGDTSIASGGGTKGRGHNLKGEMPSGRKAQNPETAAAVAAESREQAMSNRFKEDYDRMKAKFPGYSDTALVDLILFSEMQNSGYETPYYQWVVNSLSSASVPNRDNMMPSR